MLVELAPRNNDLALRLVQLKTERGPPLSSMWIKRRPIAGPAESRPLKPSAIFSGF